MVDLYVDYWNSFVLILHCVDYQELRCREEDLNRAQVQQRMHEEHLRLREQELQAREIDLLERELHFMIKQQTPTPNKRKGSER